MIGERESPLKLITLFIVLVSIESINQTLFLLSDRLQFCVILIMICNFSFNYYLRQGMDRNGCGLDDCRLLTWYISFNNGECKMQVTYMRLHCTLYPVFFTYLNAQSMYCWPDRPRMGSPTNPRRIYSPRSSLALASMPPSLPFPSSLRGLLRKYFGNHLNSKKICHNRQNLAP